MRKLTVRLLVVLSLVYPVLAFLGNSAVGQGQVGQQIAGQLSAFNKKNLPEKVFLHTDKSSYLVGETLWFKVYAVDGTTHTQLGLSKVAYVDILDQNQVPVLQVKVGLQNGKGAGAITLPLTVGSGHYILRGYTNWMKNAPAAFFFQQPLTIVNTFQPLGLKEEDLSNLYHVQFFPEGGHLVNGLQSKVAFKATDKNGKGVSFIGAVLNNQNDTVARFYTHKFGIGSFTFTPEAGHTYRAILRGDTKQLITRPLPAAQDQGMVMQVTETGPETLQVQVAVSPATPGTSVYFLSHTRQGAVQAHAAVLDAQGKTNFTLHKSSLAEGVSHLTLFNASRKPVCERLYFKQPQAQLLTLSGTSDQRVYGPRAPVTLSLQARSGAGVPEAAEVSVSVYRVDSLQFFAQQSIESYLWLSADLKGAIESPEYYFSTPGPEVSIAQDNLMLTHGWRRFAWDQVLQPNPVIPAFLPEYNGHLLYGRVVNNLTGAPVPFVQTYLSSPSRRVQVATARSDRQGVVIFDLKDLYGTRDLILQANTRQDSTLRLEILTPFSGDSATLALPAFEVKEQLKPHLLAKTVYVQVQNHHAPIQVSFPAITLDTTTFFNKPFRSYLLDDYTRFPTLEDVLKEYVYPVTLRKKKGSFQLTVLDAPRKELLEEDPLVLLDGVPLFDLDRLMAYDPKKVRKVEVVAQRFFHGGHAYGGVVSFTTYQGDLESFEIDPKALLVEYEGLQHTREFYHPVYTGPEQVASRIPDLRSVLYWTPFIELTPAGAKQIKFYTSDRSGKYLVVVRGMTADGKAGSHTFSFEVKPAI